jgi:hypothetical protein
MADQLNNIRLAYLELERRVLVGLQIRTGATELGLLQAEVQSLQADIERVSSSVSLHCCTSEEFQSSINSSSIRPSMRLLVKASPTWTHS